MLWRGARQSARHSASPDDTGSRAQRLPVASVPGPTVVIVLATAILTAAATVGLAVRAYCQMQALAAQAKDQKAENEAALAIAVEQSAAALAIARETREAAQRQWQQRVFAHAWRDPAAGDGTDATPDELAVPY